MTIIKTFGNLIAFIRTVQANARTVGFVPTMGALHEGHLALVRQANAIAHYTVVSIFVNPTQFNEEKDLDNYPRTIAADIQQLEQVGVDVLFLPTTQEIYPTHLPPLPAFDFGELSMLLEGAYRPGHFDGVVQVMHRFLDQLQPDWVFMGLKDYQQQLIIQNLLEQMPIRTKLMPCAIVREESGLAMSSRNQLLTTKQRNTARQIYATLQAAKSQMGLVAFEQIESKAIQALTSVGFEVDYFAIVDPATLTKPSHSDQFPVLICVAAWLSGIRLIDNLLVETKASNGQSARLVVSDTATY